MTDRPDKTESPYTVPPGHFQFETDLVTYSRRGDQSATSFNVINLKLGLTLDTDLQLILGSYRVSGEGRGFGDAIARFKINLVGNDSGPASFGLMPYFKTRQGREVGLIVPLFLKLPQGWELGTMIQIDRAEMGSGQPLRTDLISSWAVGHDLVAPLSAYAELFSQRVVAAGADSAWIGTVDFGLLYLLTPTLQLDAGVNVGVTEAADDLNPFVGISARF